MRHAHQALETSDPALAPLLIGYHPSLNIHICLHEGCLRAVTAIAYHLRSCHREFYDKLTREQKELIPQAPSPPVSEFLPDFHHSRPPPELPYLATTLGVVCKRCHFALPSNSDQPASSRAKKASAHLRAHHDDLPTAPWQNHFSPVPQRLQTFFHPQRRNEHRYFPVGPPAPKGWIDVPSIYETDGDQDQNFAAFNEFLDTPIPYDAEDDLHNIHPLLRQYRLHHYLADFDRDLIHELANIKVTPDEPPAFALVGPLLKSTFLHIFKLSRKSTTSPGADHTNMQWLWSFAPNGSVFADGPPDSAFLDNVSCTTLLENYVPTIVRLVLVGLRCWHLQQDRSNAGIAARALLPPFFLTRIAVIRFGHLHKLLRERTHLPFQKEAEVDVPCMEVVINALRSLLQASDPDEDEGTDPNPPLVFRFLAMFAARRDGGFRPCSLLTPPTHHLITASRAVILWLAVHRPPPVDAHAGAFRDSPPRPSPQHALHASILHHRHHIVVDGRSTPFSFLHSFFNITRALALNEASFTPHVWTDGSKQSRFTADGVPFDTQKMAKNLRILRAEVRHLYMTEVLRGYPFQPIPLDDVVDDPRTLKPGYSFATDPVNDLRAKTQHAHRYLEAESERGHPQRE